MKLHAYWDSGAEYFEEEYKIPLTESDKFELREWGTELMQKYPREFYKGEAENNDVEDWV